MDARERGTANGRSRRRITVAVTVLAFALLTGVAFADPDARFVASDSTPRVNETVVFGAVERCNRDRFRCDWSFGDGATADGRIVRHSYGAAGRYEVRLTVTERRNNDDEDEDERRSDSSMTIVVRGPDPPPPPPETNEDPTARFSFSPGEPEEGQAVSFNGAGSSDPERKELSYLWDFGDRGATASGQAASHVFAGKGEYRVRLTVTDPGGKSDTTSSVVRVRERPRANSRPTAGISVSNDAPLTAQAITLGSSSRDADGSIASTRWDIDGDGFDDGTTASISVSFALPGSYQVRLRVTDNANADATASTTIRVGNRRPTALFDYTPKFIAQGQAVSFTSKSSDPEGRLDSQQWDLDGDGQFDDATGAKATATFSSTKSVSIGLRVTDRDGGSAERRLQIAPGNRAPTGSITVSPDPPQPGVPAMVSAELEDPDGSVTARAWDLDDDGEFDDGDGDSVQWTFPSAGPHRVFVRATDNSGSSAVIARTLDVGGAPGVPTTAAGGPSAPLRLMSPFPVIRVAGSLTSRGANLRLVSVLAPRGARIEVRCSGKGCARGKLVTKSRSKKAKRLKTFQRRYRAGARLEVRVTSTTARRIGKYTRITIRKGKKPARVDKCLMPGSAKPAKCPG